MKKISCLIMCLLILGCNNVKDLKFTGNNTEEIIDKVKKSKDLTGEETGLLMAPMLRYGITNQSFKDKRVKDIIEEQKKINIERDAKEKETKRLAEEAAKREADLAAELVKYINVAPFYKSYEKADYMSGQYQDKITMRFVFENNGEKNIKAFKGTTKFKDLFGEDIYSSELSYDAGVPANSKINFGGSIKFNQFSQSEVKLRDTRLENMKFEWIPKAVIFTDGSTLGM